MPSPALVVASTLELPGIRPGPGRQGGPGKSAGVKERDLAALRSAKKKLIWPSSPSPPPSGRIGLSPPATALPLGLPGGLRAATLVTALRL